MNRARAALFVAVTTFVATAVIATSARAACPYYLIDTLGTYVAGADPSIVILPQSQPVWSAFAIRPVAGEDWDVQLFQNAAADPLCVSGPVAASAAFGSIVDFVIGDYSYNPAGDYFAKCTRYSGASGAYVRWRESPQVMTVNGPTVLRSWNGADVIETWNTQLVSGTTYTVNFLVSAGLDAKVMLFRNPAAGPYWAGRGAAVLTSSTTTTYTASSSGTYAVVVVNDNGGTGSLSLAIGTCPTPTVMASGAAVHTPLGYTYHRFTQSFAYWTAIGVRSTTSDYDIYGWGGTAGTWPYCLSDLKAVSGGVGMVDFVIGDFNHNPTGTYYANTYDYSETGGADIEWDSGANTLTVNGTAVSRTSDTTDVLEVWDVFLSAGQTYNFAFDPSGSNMHMLLFRNTGGGVYWSGRTGAQFDVTGCQTYTAPTSGYYGVVVVNETGATSTYSLGVSQAPCPCAATLSPGAPAITPSPDGYFRFTQLPNFWAVVATRGFTNADDWDLTLSASATGNPAPTCLGSTLVSSAYGAGLVDIGVIDFDTTPLGTYFARTHHYSGGAPSGLIEWDWTHGELYHNGFVQYQAMSSTDLAHSWDAYMVAGQTYVLEYTPTDVTIKLLVFENAGGGTYAVSRASAVLTTSSTINYTPTVTGFHGLVVVNDGAVSGSYTIRYGSCATAALTSGTTILAGENLNYFSFSQHGSRWAAAGVRSTTADWDMRVSATTSSPFPNCVGASIASSSAGVLKYVDFVTGDFFHNAPGTYYMEALQYSGASLIPSRVEWSEGEEVLVNDNRPILGPTDATDVLHSYSVYLQSGVPYTFDFGHNGTADLHLMLFRNAGGGVYWAPRSSRVFDLTAGATPFTYVPPSTGEYGLVLANDDGVDDFYYFTVKACFGNTALASGVSVVDNPIGFHSFAQAPMAWTAVGVRSTSDWDISVNLNPAGGPPGSCQSGQLGNSGLVGPVDFVVGDFNAGGNVPGTYYALPYRFGGDQIATVEWDSGADKITIGNPTIHRATGATDVLEVWDVFLTSGHVYAVYFTRSGAADTRVLLFRNPGGAYWAGRYWNVFESDKSATYTAPSTGWYGVVVVNDNGAAGDYNLGVYETPLAVEIGGNPGVTSLRSVQPNPARSRMAVEYTLSERAPVRLQLIDLAGRVIADVENQVQEPGVWRSGWNGLTNAGTKAPPGIYLVRLEVAGRAVGHRKVTVLE